MVGQPRPVWLTEAEALWLDLTCDLNAEGRALLKAKWDAAPSDPTEAAAKAIFDSSRESDDECSWDDEPNEWIKKAYRDYESLAVLRALGMPL